MEVQSTSIHILAKDWLDNGLSNEQIVVELQKHGVDERHVPDMLAEIKKLRNARQTSNGLIFILIGAVICLLSCVLTITSTFSHTTFQIVLYGFTTIGILMVFWGLMKIFN